MEKEDFLKEFLAYEKTLIRYAQYKLHDRPLAEDLVGLLFFNIWKNWDGTLKNESIKAYMKRSLKNLIINERNKRKLIRRQTFINDQEILYSLMSPEQEMILKEIMEEIREKYPDALEIISLKELDELKIKEIAARLGVSESTAKRRIKEATAKLRKFIGDDFFIFVIIIAGSLILLLDVCKETLFK
ncbi:MAG: sigma-70 family RNA polymerase sigma factor [Tannerellaceae bacterium]|nr:sigma-70 family RNA polymerase sigma factor [Tannerellaceae bacterium]